MVSYAPTYNTTAQPRTWDNAAAEAWAQQNLGRQMTAGGGNIINAARDAGLLEKLQGDIELYENPQQLTPQGQSGGFIPATVDPLHQYEKAGLQTMGDPGALGGGSMTMANQYLQNLMQNTQTVNPMAMQYLQQGAQMVQDAVNPVTMEQIEAFRNPYAQALQDRLTEEGEIARQKIMAQQGTRGARSFGDIAQGRRESYLDAELGRRRGDIDYRTYQDSLGYLQNLQRLQAQGGQALAGMGTAAQGITSSGANVGLGLASGVFGAGQKLTDQGYETARQQIGAGQYIRNYNQRINDAIAANILGASNYEPQQISTIQQLLAPFQSGMQNQMVNQPSTLGQLGGAMQFAGGAIDYFNQPIARPSSDFVGPMPSRWSTMF